MLQRLAADPDKLEAEDLRDEVARCGATPIADCPEREPVYISGTLRTVKLRPRAGVPALEAELWDGTGSVTVVWLGRRQIPGIQPGRRIRVRGRVTTFDGRRAIYNPLYELRPSGESSY
jgi:DNA/RNA endonuclease YhcR with UshA esterase domain